MSLVAATVVVSLALWSRPRWHSCRLALLVVAVLTVAAFAGYLFGGATLLGLRQKSLLLLIVLWILIASEGLYRVSRDAPSTRDPAANGAAS